MCMMAGTNGQSRQAETKGTHYCHRLNHYIGHIQGKGCLWLVKISQCSTVAIGKEMLNLESNVPIVYTNAVLTSVAFFVIIEKSYDRDGTVNRPCVFLQSHNR